MQATNIFVYHGQDRESRVLASMVRLCDVERRFSFLPVESPDSVDRMHKFLHRNGLRPDGVALPFLIVVQPPPPHGGESRRTVMHGEAMANWLNNLVGAVVEGGTPRSHVLENLVACNLSPYTLRLLAYALAREPEVTLAPPPPPPSSSSSTAPVVVAAAAVSGPPQPQLDDEASAASVTTMASVPLKKKDNAVNIADVMAQSKVRESMHNGSRGVGGRPY